MIRRKIKVHVPDYAIACPEYIMNNIVTPKSKFR